MRIATIQEFAVEIFQGAPSDAVRDERFAGAMDLICRHQRLDLNLSEVRDAALDLDVLIPALLAFSKANNFIKFDPWDPTILVKEFPPSLIAYQYNPFRDIRNRQASGQKAAPVPGKRPDFLDWETFPDAEHYLIWTAASGRRYGILVQPVPIVPGHLIIASLDREASTGEHFPQAMMALHMTDIHELQVLLGSLGYAMGFNDHDAGASVDHFHTQAILKRFLPLIRAWEANRIHAPRTVEMSEGPSLRVLDNTLAAVNGVRPYPANGILLESSRPECMLAPKLALLNEMLSAPLVYNSIGWRLPDGRYAEVFFPRSQETILNHSLKAGYVEMAGMLVIPSREVYDGLTGPEGGETGLGDAGLSAECFRDFLSRVLSACNCPII